MKKTPLISLFFLAIIVTSSAQINNGLYTIKLAASGKALDADYPNIKNDGCIVHLWDYKKESVTQNWAITKLNNKADNPFNTYKITLAASGKALDAEQTNIFNNDCKIRLWGDNKGGQSQAWLIKALGNNKFQIVLAASGKALDADAPNINKNNCIIHLWDKRNDGFNTQTWIIELSEKAIAPPVIVVPPPPSTRPLEGVVRDHRTEPATIVRYTQWNNLKTQTEQNYDDAIQKHQGIIAMDALFPDLAYIGMGTVSVEWTPGFNRPTHKPIDGYKRPITGFAIGFNRGEEDFTGDNDATSYIFPNVGNRYFEEKISSGTTNAKKAEAEIDIPDKYWEQVKTYLPKPFTQISAYGAWVHEKHNYWDTRVHDVLEIHPMENLWWTTLMANRMAYRIGVFSDSSAKFTKWTPNPVLAINAIAFEYIQGQKPLRFKMSMRAENNIISYPNYYDEAETHCLLDVGDSILTVEEPLGLKNKISIDFEKVSKVFDAKLNKFIYKGFIKIHTAVKEGGIALFDVVEMNTIHSFTPKRIKVTLEKISCITADDDGGDEELYGKFAVNAITGMKPFYVNISEEANGGNGRMLWNRGESNNLSLKKGQIEEINSTVIFSLPAAGEIVLYGDLDESDGVFNTNDKLGADQVTRVKVQDIINQSVYKIFQNYKSGGTNIKVDFRLEIIN